MSQIPYMVEAWPLLLVLLAVGGLLAAAALVRLDGSTALKRCRRVGVAAFVGWLAVTAFFVTYPRPATGVRLVTELAWSDNPSYLVNFLANVVMFLPAGAVPMLWRLRWRLAAVPVAAVLSVLIEAVQYVGRFGRTADVNDVYANTLAALLGFAAAGAVVGAARVVVRLRNHWYRRLVPPVTA